MEFDEHDLTQVRRRAIELIRDDRWRFGGRALSDLRRRGYTQLQAADLIHQALEADRPIKLVRMTDSDGPNRIGYAMTRVDGGSLYVKFVFNWSWTEVIFISSHESVHE